MLDTPLLHTVWAKRVVPIALVFILAYYDFASYYALGYQEIWKHHAHGSALCLWIISGICQFLMMVYWILILILGPGKSPKVAPFDLFANNNELTKVPDIFFCDQYGYPYYCSQTQSIALPRTFYSKDLRYNTLKYDHYCVWIGTVVGRDNYVFFCKFIGWFLSFFLVTLVFLVRYTPSNAHRGLNHNLIPLYVISAFGLLMVGALVAQNIRYISLNMTTLDDITLNQRKRYMRWKHKHQGTRVKRNKMPRVEKGDRYVNVKDSDGIRVVVKYDIEERPFDLGFKCNWINFALNGNRSTPAGRAYTSSELVTAFIVFLVPFSELFVRKLFIEPTDLLERYLHDSDRISESFLEKIMEKVVRKDCYLPSYVRVETDSTGRDKNERELEEEKEKLGVLEDNRDGERNE